MSVAIDTKRKTDIVCENFVIRKTMCYVQKLQCLLINNLDEN